VQDPTHYWAQVSWVDRVRCVAGTSTFKCVVPLVSDSATGRNIDDRLVVRGNKRVNTTVALHKLNDSCQRVFQHTKGDHPRLTMISLLVTSVTGPSYVGYRIPFRCPAETPLTQSSFSHANQSKAHGQTESQEGALT
jgi:hypothetical protein